MQLQPWTVYSVFTLVAEIAANEMLEKYPALCIRVPREATPPDARFSPCGIPLLFAIALPEDLTEEFCLRIRNLQN